MRAAAAWITAAVLTAGLIAASASALWLGRAADSVRLELGARRLLTLEPSLVELIRSGKAPLSVMLFITDEADTPSDRRGLEADLTELLTSLATALPGRFDFGVTDPAKSEDMQSFASKRGVTPFRALGTRGDRGEARELYATLLFDWGPLGSARVEHIGPEHLPILQAWIEARLRELLAPTRPHFALLAPAAADFSALTDLLAARGTFERYDPAAQNFDWEQLYSADLIFWMRPGADAMQALPEVERLVDSGRALCIGGSPFGNKPSPGFAGLALGLGVDVDEQPLANATVTSIAPDQDFRLFTGQPNGTLSFASPAALGFDPVVLARRATSARFLATTREDESGPKRGLMVLLDPADARRGRIVLAAATTPFEEFATGAHRALVDVLVRSFTGADRRALLAALPHPPRAVPESTSSERLLLRALVSLPLPLLLGLFALWRRRRQHSEPRTKSERPHKRRASRLLPLAAGLALVLAANAFIRHAPHLAIDLTEDQLSEPSAVTLDTAADLASGAARLRLELLASPASKLPGDLSQLTPRLEALVRAAEGAGLAIDFTRRFPEDLETSEREDLERAGIQPFSFAGPVGLGGEEARSAWASLRLSLPGQPALVLSFESGAELDELEFRFAFALEKLRLGHAPRLGFASDLPRMSAAENYEFQSQGSFAPREGDVFGRARRALARSGFDVVHINPRGSDEELTAAVGEGQLDGLLWLQPRREVRPMLAAFASYVSGGGRAMLAAQHFRTQARRYRGAGYETVFWPQPQLIDIDRFWLPEFGVSLVRRVRFDELDARLPIASRLNGKTSETEFEPLVTRAPFLVRIPSAQFTADPLMRGVSDLLIPDPTAIELDPERLATLGLTARPLFSGSSHSWSLDWKGGWLPDELLDAAAPEREFETPPLFGVVLSGRFPAPTEAWGDRPPEPATETSAPGELVLFGSSACFTDELLDQGGASALLLNTAAELALADFGPRGAALAHLAGRRPADRGLGLTPEPERRRAKLLVIGGGPAALLLLVLLRRLAQRLRRGTRPQLHKPQSPALGPLPWRPALAALLIGGLAFGGLAALPKSPTGGLVFGRVVPPKVRAETVAALALQAPESLGGGHWTYAHQSQPDGSETLWRELEGAGALGDPAAILATIEDLFDAEGQVVASDKTSADGLGFTPESAWRIELFRPEDATPASDKDQPLLERLGKPFFTAELGLASPDGRAVMLRAAANPAIWSVDRNPRYRLEGTLDRNDAKRRLATAPPLADRALVPISWPGRPAGLAAVAWQRQGEKSQRLIEVAIERTPEELQAGQRPTAWRLVGDGTDELLDAAPLPRGPAPPSATQSNPGAAEAYLEFVARSTYTELLDPARATELGLGPGTSPTAILLYASRPTEAAPKGYSFTLSIGPELSPAQGGGHAAIHSASRNLIRLSKAFVEAALPHPADFHSPKAAQHWRLR